VEETVAIRRGVPARSRRASRRVVDGFAPFASVRGRSTSGPNAGQRWRRLGDRVEPVDGKDDPEASLRVPQHGGIGVEAEALQKPKRPSRSRGALSQGCVVSTSTTL
jgi:hypothetical protein